MDLNLKEQVSPQKVKTGFRFPLNLTLYKKILNSLGGPKHMNTILNEGKINRSEFLELIHFLLNSGIMKPSKKKTKKKKIKKKTKRK